MVDFVPKRLQVFVSSTFADLRVERQAAVEAILVAGHIPAGMELFTSGDESQMEVINQWIDESDVYLLILGGRYGSIEPKSGKSYIHLEYEYAIEKAKPLFACVINEAALEARVKLQGSHAIETSEPAKLRSFRALVLSRMARFWDDQKDIKITVGETLSHLSRREDLRGWVRASSAVDMPGLADEITRLSRENSDPVWILHISDLQFGGFEKDRLLHESAIIADKVRETCKGGPTFIALTGDVAERGLPQEYDSAADWLGRLTQDFREFTMPSSRILLVPGNHDVCLPLAGSGRMQLNGATKKLELMEEKADYFDVLSSFGFAPFRQFASRVTGDHGWVEKHDDYWLTTRFKHAGFVFFGCNTAASISVSGFAERRLSMDVSGYVRQAIGRELGNQERRDLVMIGLVHHSPIAEDGDRAITNSDDFRTFCRGLGTPLIVLHGHVHHQSCTESRSAGGQILKISAATPTKNASGRPADSLRGFNLLKFNRDNAMVIGMEYSAWKWETGRLTRGPTEKFKRWANGFWERLR